MTKQIETIEQIEEGILLYEMQKQLSDNSSFWSKLINDFSTLENGYITSDIRKTHLFKLVDNQVKYADKSLKEFNSSLNNQEKKRISNIRRSIKGS